jgi:hypothetical protein
MMNMIQRFFSPAKNNHGEIRKNFCSYFLSQPEHHWIKNSSISKHFEKLFSLLPSSLLEALVSKYAVSFIRSEELKGQNPGLVFTNIIVVFPEFQKLLSSNKGSAVAYLAHELAFMLWELEEGERFEPLMAEVAADKFVCDLGLTFELEELLMMLDETIEKRLRLTYLTINHFTGQHS